MNAPIHNADDLRAERARLKNQVSLSETRLKGGVREVKEELNPVRQASGWLTERLTHRNKGLLAAGVSLGIDQLISKRLLKHAPLPLRLAVPFLLTRAAGHYVDNNRTNAVEKFLTWIKQATDDTPTAEAEEKPTFVQVTSNTGRTYVIENPNLLQRLLIWVKENTDEDRPLLLQKENPR